jgi:D-alanyl-lipoteichoic acid acyltransferase DltB (MBOAT superfamily)
MGSDGKRETKVSPVPPLDRDKLKRDLSAVNKDNGRYFFVCVAMVVLLFLVSIGVILTNLNKPDIIKVVMAAFGISSAGLITMMIKLWREKSNVELLILLAINMDAETLKTIVAVLIKRL